MICTQAFFSFCARQNEVYGDRHSGPPTYDGDLPGELVLVAQFKHRADDRLVSD